MRAAYAEIAVRGSTTERFAATDAPVSSSEASAKERTTLVSVSDSECVLMQECKRLKLAGKGECVVDKARRNWCAYCRLKRCLNANMNINGKMFRVSHPTLPH